LDTVQKIENTSIPARVHILAGGNYRYKQLKRNVFMLCARLSFLIGLFTTLSLVDFIYAFANNLFSLAGDWRVRSGIYLLPLAVTRRLCTCIMSVGVAIGQDDKTWWNCTQNYFNTLKACELQSRK